MDNSKIIINVKIPWWVSAYVNVRVFVANAFGIKIDTECLAEFAVGKLKMSVKNS